MTKNLLKILIFLMLIVSISVAYLSFFGISTKKFNGLIQSEITGINKKIELKLSIVKFKFDPLDLSISLITFDPDILINNTKLELEYIKTNISIRSFINKKFSLDDLEISTKKNKVDDIILLARSFKNTPELFILNNVIKDGLLIANIQLNFDINGKIQNDYKIKGFIQNGKIDILRKYFIKDLNFIFNIKDQEYLVQDINLNFNELKLSLPSLKIKESNNKFLVNGKLISNQDDTDFKILDSFFDNNLKKNGIKKVKLDTNNNFNFTLNKRFKINNFNLESKINLSELIYSNKSLKFQKYIPDYKDSIKFKKHRILLNYNKNKLIITGDGNILIEDNIDDLNYKITKKKDKYFFETDINLKRNPLFINFLQYKKKKDLDSIIKVNGIYKKNDVINFNLISLNENNNHFKIEDLKISNNFKIVDIKKLKLDYINDNKIRNSIDLKKIKKRYEIYGQSFDYTKFLDQMFNNEGKDTSSLFKNFNSNLIIQIDKVYLDKDTFANNLKGKISFKKNKINELNLESVFSNSKRLNLTVNTTKNKEKITTLYTDYPKPLVKQYKFIKGFEEGTLNFHSIKKNDVSNSTLIIDNFKVQEVPILAKLLTLASLQGIADLLTGEGIRFTDFEMKFSNEKKLMKIEEIYAIGPAISILMDGYIQEKELISLRGTLVPATTINRTIASIPFVGKILVGKKVGEGVFGVSFKVKGPPKNLKTTVNPIKTLTPRFITRTLEKIKKLN